MERFRISGAASTEDWMDLCIGCRLCDAVCSSGVNISELNLTAKAKYLEKKGRPFRDWLLAHAALVGPLGDFLSLVANRLVNNLAIRWLVDIFLKIDRRRKLPGYQSPSFTEWFQDHPSKGKKKIGYFYGCYANTHEVDVGKATVQALEANGFEVTLPPQRCCGIPMLGNGNFEEARKMGLKNVPSLLKTVRSGSEIVFSSTSCGHMIKFEYSRLFAITGSEEVANHLFDVFEFLRNLKESRNLNTDFRALPLKVAYFAPCHLRSLGIGLPAVEILRIIPGLQIDNIEADCCGLGGTFGFKKEKYEISQDIGKDLAEAIDRLKPEIVLSDCEGCRMQIRHLTGLKVLHPIQILRDALI